MPGKKLTIMIIPHGHSGVRKFTVPEGLIKLIALILPVTVGLFIFHVWGFYTKVYQEAKLSKLKSENAILTRRIESIRSEVNLLKRTMERLTESDRMLRALANLEDIDSDVRKAGVGGTAFPSDDPSDSLLSPAVRASAYIAARNIEQLIREAKLTEKSFKEVEEVLSNRQELLNHIPSILPAYGYFTSKFGYRINPFTRRREFHKGLDIAGRNGDPIYATADGVVVAIGFHKYMGRYVIIDHLYGYRTIYAHLSTILVHKGQKVKRGQKIAEMGSSGRSTNPHLHYAVSWRGELKNPEDFIYSDSDFY